MVSPSRWRIASARAPPPPKTIIMTEFSLFFSTVDKSQKLLQLDCQLELSIAGDRQLLVVFPNRPRCDPGDTWIKHVWSSRKLSPVSISPAVLRGQLDADSRPVARDLHCPRIERVGTHHGSVCPRSLTQHVRPDCSAGFFET